MRIGKHIHMAIPSGYKNITTAGYCIFSLSACECSYLSQGVWDSFGGGREVTPGLMWGQEKFQCDEMYRKSQEKVEKLQPEKLRKNLLRINWFLAFVHSF